MRDLVDYQTDLGSFKTEISSCWIQELLHEINSALKQRIEERQLNFRMNVLIDKGLKILVDKERLG